MYDQNRGIDLRTLQTSQRNGESPLVPQQVQQSFQQGIICVHQLPRLWFRDREGRRNEVRGDPSVPQVNVPGKPNLRTSPLFAWTNVDVDENDTAKAYKITSWTQNPVCLQFKLPESLSASTDTFYANWNHDETHWYMALLLSSVPQSAQIRVDAELQNKEYARHHAAQQKQQQQQQLPTTGCRSATATASSTTTGCRSAATYRIAKVACNHPALAVRKQTRRVRLRQRTGYEESQQGRFGEHGYVERSRSPAHESVHPWP